MAPNPNYERRAVLRRVAIGIEIALLCAVAYFGLRLNDSDDDSAVVPIAGELPGSTSDPATTPVPADADPATASTPPTVVATTIRVASAGPTTSTTEPSQTVPVTPPVSTGAPSPPTSAPMVQAEGGDVAPVVAIFDVDTITLAGAVPSQEAADRLELLAQANSKTPATIIDLLTIDPEVPAGVGVRVVELNSTRFESGEAYVTLAHAVELRRMVAFMQALPDTTVLVVGHADQVGDDAENLAISQARAAAVVEFMVDEGIDPGRLTATAVGESDLLTLEDDETARALNRRTEFVVYGALVA